MGYAEGQESCSTQQLDVPGGGTISAPVCTGGKLYVQVFGQ